MVGRGQFRVRSLAVLVAVVAVGLALAPRDAPGGTALAVAALVAAPVAGRLAPLGAAGLAAIALVLAGWVEVILAVPVPAWVYWPIALAFAAACWPRDPRDDRRSRLAFVGAIWAAILLLYLVPWSSRKPFLWALDSIRPGMTVAEVVARMDGYELSGFGSPDPYDPPAITSPAEALMLTQGRLVFRPPADSTDHADRGIVEFRAGRVVHVKFSPD